MYDSNGQPAKVEEAVLFAREVVENVATKVQTGANMVVVVLGLVQMVRWFY